jgi:ElaB/YqjD/DUF883 family membrane-anchored ribosome-binding protein
MTHSPKPGDEPRSLPDDIALSAGMPRGHYDDVPHSHSASTTDDLRSGTESLRDKALEAADTAHDLRERASHVYDDGRRRLDDLGERGSERFREGRSAVEDFVTDNPLLVGVVGLAAGLLLGALLPRTRQEDETVGPWADEVRDQGLRYARDVTHRGREFVASALDPDNLQAAAQRVAGTDTQGTPGERPTSPVH